MNSLHGAHSGSGGSQPPPAPHPVPRPEGPREWWFPSPCIGWPARRRRLRVARLSAGAPVPSTSPRHGAHSRPRGPRPPSPHLVPRPERAEGVVVFPGPCLRLRDGLAWGVRPPRPARGRGRPRAPRPSRGREGTGGREGRGRGKEGSGRGREGSGRGREEGDAAAESMRNRCRGTQIRPACPGAAPPRPPGSGGLRRAGPGRKNRKNRSRIRPDQPAATVGGLRRQKCP